VTDGVRTRDTWSHNPRPPWRVPCSSPPRRDAGGWRVGCSLSSELGAW